MKTLATYRVESEGVPADVAIVEKEGEYVNLYELRHTRIKDATAVALTFLKEHIIEAVNIKVSEILDPRESENIRARVVTKARELVRSELSGLSPEEENVIVGRLAQEMLGLGELELVLADDNLEEIVINSSHEPVWVYHKKFGWLKTNVRLSSEEQIQNYASIIGRRVGRQITNLEPLMDAHLLSGDRVNATLFPISTKGNSITIRKFAKDPWTIVSLINNNTLSPDAAALFWLAIQYEFSVLVGGGTASGKTSFLNAMLAFTPPNQRVVSIEDSVEGSARILVFENGGARLTSMAELVDRKIEREHTLLPDGAQLAYNTGGTKVLSSRRDGRIELVEPTVFIRHQTFEPLYRVETEGGSALAVTADHSLFSFNESNALVPVKTRDLSEGSSIAVVDGFSSLGGTSSSPNAMLQLVNHRTLTAHPQRVRRVTRLPGERRFVYDLSVPGNESFLVNNIVAHNTRELVLPDFLHWTPMSTRQPNPEGKGGIEMLDLMVNSLRMRPDRIVLGEIRRQREAEVLFEAMHTGHSVYSTLHADDSSQVRNRLISPPISLPESVIGALQLVVVQYRQRRAGIRRTYEISEVVPGDDGVSMNVVHKWDARSDTLVKVGDHIRLINDLTLHTGMTQKEIYEDLSNKQLILSSMAGKGITNINDVGRIVGWYYREPGEVLALARANNLIKLVVSP